MKRNLLALCAGVPCSSLGITGDRSRDGNDHLSGTSMGGETGESAQLVDAASGDISKIIYKACFREHLLGQSS